jgi:hypothetical protein
MYKMPGRVITQVTLENFHELVPEYIHHNNTIIQNYDDVKEVYLSMLRDNHLFTFDRDILIACLTDLTYMYAPGDDVNKDAVVELLVLETELEEDDMDDDESVESDDPHPVDRTISFAKEIDTSLDVQADEECTTGM